MRIAVIPARGGSKRIPRKNIRNFAGRPIIAWSIEAAARSGCFHRIIVSTDDAEIASVARQCGAETPFMRPPELADDHAGTLPVMHHAVQWMVDAGMEPQQACCIYATAPFVQAEDIRRGLEVLEHGGCDYAFSVTRYPSPIQRALRLSDAGRIGMFQPEYFDCRSQDLEEAFHDAGQFYWGRAKAWLSEKTIFSADAAPVLLPRHRVEDIDTQEDWVRAEAMFKAMQAGGIQ